MLRERHIFNHALTRLVPVLLLASLCSGCLQGGRSPFARPTRWTVELQNLDHVSFHWKPGMIRREGTPQSYLIELYGNGFLTIASGTGAHVNDPFEDTRAGAAPIDEKRDQIVIPLDQTRMFYQRLVNTGFFKKDLGLSGGDRHTGPTLLVFAKINGRKRMQATDDPEMVALFEVLRKAF